MKPSHIAIEPAILYFGTPVVLISTLNPDGTTNIAPNSSVWWLGWSCMLGLDASSQTTENLIRTGECVLNLVSYADAGIVNTIAMTTGRKKVPPHKKMLGYHYEKNKHQLAEITELPSELVAPTRIQEPPIHLEATLSEHHQFASQDPRTAVPVSAFELRIRKVHIDPGLLKPLSQKVDPDKWNPAIMNFREIYGLTGKACESRLARRSENLYAPWKFGSLGRWVERRLAKSE